MAADYSRIHRLLKIITLIQGSQGWTATRLALECGVSERSIFRDLKTISQAGIPYFFDEAQKSYSIRKDFFLPPVQLTLDEALALAAMAERIGGDEQIPFLTSATKAIAKVRGLLPNTLRKELDAIESHVAIQLAAASSQEGTLDVYSRIRQAIAARKAVKCEYESASGNDGKGSKLFVFHPYCLFWGQRAWYVLGYHGKHKEVRCLRLSRFTGILPTEDSYEIDNRFSVEEHLGNAWRMIKGEKRYDIELHFDKEFADTVSETQWHKSQELTFEEDGSLTFRCSVDGLEEIIWWILSMGPHCVVKKPTVLAERVQELARELLSKYEKEKPDAATASSPPKRTITPKRT